jgi:hypothetical protein
MTPASGTQVIQVIEDKNNTYLRLTDDRFVIPIVFHFVVSLIIFE